MENLKKKFYLLLIFIPIIIVFGLYHSVLNCHFGWEDTMLLGDAAKTLTSGNLKYIFFPWNGYYSRLFWQPTAVIFYKVFGYTAAPFYALVLLFHLSNVFLTFKIAQKTTKSIFIAFFSSLLYGVYQVNLEPIAWISSGTKDLAMTTFFLFSLFFFMKFLDQKLKINFYLFLSYLFFALSFSSEFKAILIPLVFFSYELLAGKNKFNLKKLPGQILKYIPYFLIIFFLLLAFYNQTPKLFSGFKKIDFFISFPAALSLYVLPLSRIFWTKIFVNAHLVLNLSDEQYLKNLGMFILGSIIVLIFFLWIRKERLRSLLLLFFLSGVFLNFLPVMTTVLSGYHTLWVVTTAQWRYFTLSSPLAAILVTSSFFWANEEIYKIIKKVKFLPIVFKIPFFPALFLSLFIFFHIEFDRIILFNYHLKWKIPAKNIFWQIKEAYPILAKETIFVIEGTDKETTFPYFQHRYLFENIFSLYANPNNPNYADEQKRLLFGLAEGSDRTLKRILYYTNMKDFLVGNHRHLYQEVEDITFISPTLSWALPAFDRLFLGAIYGYYNPEKVIDFKFSEDGSLANVTDKRKKEIKEFLNYFCFDQGTKKCFSKSTKNIPDFLVKDTISSFSTTGKLIMEFLIKNPPGILPKIGEIKVPSNL